MPNSLRNKIKHFCYKGYLSESEKNKLLNALDDADRINGKWIFKNDNIAIPTGYFQCSKCKEGKLLVKDNYCPNCGAKMAESEEA